ncbi:MAG: DUF1428 domain-containing protein [Ancylobacter novellus]|uniref:DUF1428 domain-containing protein n=1 Tax=Ancylobacter novellus TaxID=921 RepID=A0A2W5KFV1_ANCNO|nr:MAG: DUF1428 domain-containing protein [Ancylobacter novellus]
MSYVEGFVLAVPAANKEAYRSKAAAAVPLFKEFGVARHVEAWGDEVPDGKLTDFKSAVKAREDEVVVFSWFEYPDRATRDAANEKIMSDLRMKEMCDGIAFDPQRMIYAGFATILDVGPKGAMGYANGMVVPVPASAKNDYCAFSSRMADVIIEHGASRVVDAWGDDVAEGEVTDYARAVKAVDGETVVFSWIEWPSKAAHDAGWAKIMADPRMQPGAAPMPFDGRRLIHGGFAPILDA